MKSEDMMDVISQISDTHIEEFARPRPSRFYVPWNLVATVAVFCAVIASAMFLRSTGLLSDHADPTQTTQTTVPTTTEIPLTKVDMKAIHTVFSHAFRYCKDEMDESWRKGFASDSSYQTVRDLLDSVFSTGFDEERQCIQIEIIDMTDEKIAAFQKIFSNEDYMIFSNRSSDGADLPSKQTDPRIPDQSLSKEDLQSVHAVLSRMLWYCKNEMDESWRKGFQTDSSYQRIRDLLDAFVSCEFNEAQQHIEIGIVDLTDKKVETFKKIFSDEDYIVFDSISPDDPLPTQPSQIPEPTTPFPDIPEISSPQAIGKPQVFTNYEVNAGWSDHKGNRCDVSVRIPGLRADSEGAKAINEQIRTAMEAQLSSLRRSYLENSYTSTETIDYESWQSGDILAVKITISKGTSETLEYEYYLNTSTGKALSAPDLTGLSYLEWLYRCCSTLKNHIGEDHDDGCGMFVGIRMDGDGRLWLGHTCYMEDSRQEFPFDPTAGAGADIDEMYHWIFNIIADGAFSQQHSHHLQAVFSEDPALFLDHLSREVTECGQVIGSQLLYELTQEEKDAHLALCTSLRDSASAPAIAQTAQLLLDAFENPGAGSVWATCRARFASITDLDSAMTISKVLHYCCFDDIRAFIHYMDMLDESCYDECWQAILTAATEEETVQLSQTALAVIETSDATDYERNAAQSLLQLLQSLS